jgi:hypothetical protein
MAHELFYTSAPKGLVPGSQGFCTVAATAGFPPSLMQKVEALSGYRALYPPHDPNADLNPVMFGHVRLSAGGKNYHVLSRICAAGLDYTQRSNKFAHHIVLENHELTTGGPAWLLGQPGFMEQTWDGQVRTLPEGRPVPRGDCEVRVCKAWEALTGDAGWAGVVAESLLTDPERPIYLVFEPGMELLPLLAEALALLPPARRWEATFNTYFAKASQGISCACRGVLTDTTEAKDAERLPNTLVINLAANLGQAHGGPLVERARTGQSSGPQGDRSPPPMARVHAAKQRTESVASEGSGTASRPKGDFASWPSRAGYATAPASQGAPPPLPVKQAIERNRPSSQGGWFLGFAQGTVTGFLLTLGVLTGLYFLGGFTLVKVGAKVEDQPPNPPDQARVAEVREEKIPTPVSVRGKDTPADKIEGKQVKAPETTKPVPDGAANTGSKAAKSNEESKSGSGKSGDLHAKVCAELPVQVDEEKLIASFPGEGSQVKLVCENEFIYEGSRSKLHTTPTRDGQRIEYEVVGALEGRQEFAHLSISSRGVSLKWSPQQNRAVLAARKHLRNGLLEVTGADGAKTYWAMRRPIEEEWNFGLPATTSLTRILAWKDQERPSGRLRLAVPAFSVAAKPISFQPGPVEHESYQRAPDPPLQFSAARDERVFLQDLAVKLGKDQNSIVIDLAVENPDRVEEPARFIWPKIHLDNLVVYTEVSGVRVDVVHFFQKGK